MRIKASGVLFPDVRCKSDNTSSEGRSSSCTVRYIRWNSYRPDSGSWLHPLWQAPVWVVSKNDAQISRSRKDELSCFWTKYDPNDSKKVVDRELKLKILKLWRQVKLFIGVNSLFWFSVACQAIVRFSWWFYGQKYIIMRILYFTKFTILEYFIHLTHKKV